MDLDLGMNNWMADPFPDSEESIAAGRCLTAEDLDRLGGFARYKDSMAMAWAIARRSPAGPRT